MSATTTDTVVEMQHGDVINLSSLPTELLFELALRSPIRALRCVVRFDARLVACVRLQRWYRRFEAPVDTCLSVGDRVLVRGASANLPRLQYATVAAQMRERDLWKVQLLNDEYANVPSSRIHRLQEWGDGPRTGSVALSAAVASASRARGAATHATAAAVLAMHADASSAQTALVIAAATAASTAAAAAAVASSAVAPVATNDMQHAQEVGELLLAANRMREAILATQGGAIALAPVASPPCSEDVTPMLVQAATAAAEAAAEASAAASAAEAAAAASRLAAADAIIVTAATAASAAEHVATAVAAMVGTSSTTVTSRAAEMAVEALAEVGMAGLALSSVLASGGDVASTTAAEALDTAQKAAKVLLGAAVEKEARVPSVPFSRSEVSSLLVGRGSMMLPATSTFEPLLPWATNVILSSAAAKKLSTHTTYELPCEDVGEPQLFDMVHRFTLQRRLALPLNQKLTKLAERKEQLASECEMRLVHTPPGPGSNASVVKTNRGGYQSYHDLFEDGSPKALLELRELVNVAISEIIALELDTAGQPSSSDAGGEARLQPSLGELHASYAWLNVNRLSDWNTVHQHHVEHWSAVYFVSDGEPNAPGFACPESGHMIFRCGPKPLPAQLPGIDTPVSSSGACSHSYMAVAPLPGSMWLFPGSMPHTVMHTVLPPGVNEPEQPRISIGINFQDARPPPPHTVTRH